MEAKSFENGNGKYSKTGIYPVTRYIITEKGKLQIGSLSCAMCHTRVLESGDLVVGGQGNVFNNTGFVNDVASGRIPMPAIQQGTKQLTFTPWAPIDSTVPALSKESFIKYLESLPSEIIDRQGTAFLHPVSVPSLIGIKDIKYLDHTGIMRHDGPGDMMRYAAFNQGMDMLTGYNGYVPLSASQDGSLPPPKQWRHPFGYVARRYSDEQLYALTQYIYSLKPPANPNKFSKSMLKDGALVFQKAGCVTCHTPPLYTNNKLTPVNGFDPPPSHLRKYDIFNVSVETDSVAALYSRRGTGYYKIPSLRGLWYRSLYFHNGHLTTLEEVFDSRRLRSDFVPSGYLPINRKSMAVKGHPFGLDLTEKEKASLIAYLKTL
jgi:hypothetical protein